MNSPDLVLVADIGGTNSRFGLVAAGELAPRSIETVENDDFEGLHVAIPHYLKLIGERPVRAVLDVAGPMKGGTVHLTNRRGWSFRPEELAVQTGLTRIEVVNDFAALAHALPHLDAAELQPLGTSRPRSDASKVILGPGTGLGVAALVRSGQRWVASASEGGHIELAATTDREAVVYALIRRELGRVSAESVASGVGIARLDRALAMIDGEKMPQREGPEISTAARAGEPRAREVMDLFFAALARFAGDMALTFVAQGGVYIFGGVAQKTVDLLDITEFRRNFEAKAPHESLVSAIGTMLVTAPYAALTGCAAIAAETR